MIYHYYAYNWATRIKKILETYIKNYIPKHTYPSLLTQTYKFTIHSENSD